jgi:tripartite ATP-independent transporter DctP family solute receptor
MKLRRSIAGAALAAAVLVCAPAARAQPTTLLLRSAFNAQHTSSKAIEIFKAEAERRSGGSIQVELNTATGVVSTRAVLDDVRTQNIFGTWILTSHMAHLIPEMGALGLPYLFDNYDQIGRALKGPVGAAIEARLAAKGFTSLGFMEYGAQNVMNAKRPLRTLDDFRGLKLRALPDETHLATFRALGANAVGLDFKDLVFALQQGDVDGSENSYSIIYDFELYKYAKYLSDSAHVLDLIAFVVNRKAFMSLQPEQQKALREAAAIAVPQQWKMVDAGEAEALAKLKEKGMQFDPLPPETRVALRRATAAVIEDARKRVGDELIDSMLAASKSGRARATTTDTVGRRDGQRQISTKRN